MKLVAGVDIGNATTETAVARIDGKHVTFLSSGITGTTGIKGTKQNIHGVFQSLKHALDKVGLDISDLDEVRVNEAAPVIGDVAMETPGSESFQWELRLLSRLALDVFLLGTAMW